MNNINRFNQESKFAYKQVIQLNDNEVPAVVNMETGEVSTLTPNRYNQNRQKKLKIGEEYFLKNEPFDKVFAKSMEFLKRNTTNDEFAVAYELIILANKYDNSLEPLCDKTVALELSNALKCRKNLINPILFKLYQLGVYGRFDVHNPAKPFTKYWVLNPYLNFRGNIIDSDIVKIFNVTYIGMHYLGIKFKLKIEPFPKRDLKRNKQLI